VELGAPFHSADWRIGDHSTSVKKIRPQEPDYSGSEKLIYFLYFLTATFFESLDFKRFAFPFLMRLVLADLSNCL